MVLKGLWRKQQQQQQQQSRGCGGGLGVELRAVGGSLERSLEEATCCFRL